MHKLSSNDEGRHSSSLIHGQGSAFRLTTNKDYVNLGSAAGFFNPLKYNASSG